MTDFETFRKLIGPLALLLGADYDPPTWRLYHRAIEDVAPRLLAGAVERASRDRRKFPTAPELRAYAETERLAVLASMPFEGCEDCGGTGWAEALTDGVSRASRCECWQAHQRAVEALGINRRPLLLPEAEPEPFEAAS